MSTGIGLDEAKQKVALMRETMIRQAVERYAELHGNYLARDVNGRKKINKLATTINDKDAPQEDKDKAVAALMVELSMEQ